MSPERSRALIGGALALAALVAIVLPGGASGGDDASQPYPTRRLSIMAPAAAGGGWDTTARAFQKASQDAGLDDGIEVFNVEGAGGTPIATMITESEGIVVPANCEYRALDELLADFTRDPGSIRWAGGSAGSTDQLLVGELAPVDVEIGGAKPRHAARPGVVCHRAALEPACGVGSGRSRAWRGRRPPTTRRSRGRWFRF